MARMDLKRAPAPRRHRRCWCCCSRAAGAGLAGLPAGLCVAHAEPRGLRRRRPVPLPQARAAGRARRARDACGICSRSACATPSPPVDARSGTRPLAGGEQHAGLRRAAARPGHLRGLFQRPSPRRHGDVVLGGQVGARHAGRPGRGRRAHRQPRRPGDEVPARAAPARPALRADQPAPPDEHERRAALHRVSVPDQRRRQDLLLAGPAPAGAATRDDRAATGPGLAVQQLPPAAARAGARAQHRHAGERAGSSSACGSPPAWLPTPAGAWTANPPASRSWKAASTRARSTSRASASCSSTRAWRWTAGACCRPKPCARPRRPTARCRCRSTAPARTTSTSGGASGARGQDYDFSARGNHGQFVFVSPKNEVVIARNGRDYGVPPAVWMRMFEGLADRLGADRAP